MSNFAFSANRSFSKPIKKASLTCDLLSAQAELHKLNWTPRQAGGIVNLRLLVFAAHDGASPRVGSPAARQGNMALAKSCRQLRHPSTSSGAPL